MEINVELIDSMRIPPEKKASHAGRVCYQSKMPSAADPPFNVRKRLFSPGHDTTFEHSYFTFAFEWLPIAAVTFGLHLAHPFYNSDQRSGRYCTEMFDQPDFFYLEKIIKDFWPDISVRLPGIMSYVRLCCDRYQKQTSGSTGELNVTQVKECLAKERPHQSETNREATAKKIVQEQCRVFIPLLFPTGMAHTIDLVTLYSLYQTAWDPVMRHTVDLMVKAVLVESPEIGYMFDSETRNQEDWEMETQEGVYLGSIPECQLLSVIGQPVIPKDEEVGPPINRLPFSPRLMNNNTGGIKTHVALSAMSMGQDQRHRTVRRSEPYFDGGFYLPPLLHEKFEQRREAVEVMEWWQSFGNNIPSSLHRYLAPYGAIVHYDKEVDWNALIHEGNKRLCLQAQGEIYELNRQLHEQMKGKGVSPGFLRILLPGCQRTGKCVEGDRYCGRDISNWNALSDPPERFIV